MQTQAFASPSTGRSEGEASSAVTGLYQAEHPRANRDEPPLQITPPWSTGRRSVLTSIVIPVYGGEHTIAPLVCKLIDFFGRDCLQIVLVNDCSPDNSHKICLELAQANPAVVTYVRLARNFGEHNAVMAGLHHARGEHVVIMDDDFQNPPSEALKLVEEAKRGDYDVVYSYYDKKQHSLFRNMGSYWNDRVATFLLRKPPYLYLSSFKCINAFLVQQIIQYRGPHPYIDGLILRATRNIGRVQVAHDRREEGKSGYTLRKLIRLWLNMFLNFSVVPLRASALLGVLFSALGFLSTAISVTEKLLHPEGPAGWASTTALITTFAGIQLVILGLIGEYLGAMFLASNQTPQFVVRAVCEKKEAPLGP